MSTARGRAVLWVILVAGIVVRVAWCWTHRDDFIDDRDGYIAHAQAVARGEGFLGPYSHRPTAFRPPAYPIAIGLLQRTGASAAFAVALLNGLSSLVVLIVPVYLLRCESDLRDWRSSVLLCSSALLAMDPLLIRYSSLPMTEVPCAAILVCGVTLVVRSMAAADSNAGRYRRPVMLAGFAGLLFALGSLTRPAVLVACIAVAICTTLGPLLMKIRRGESASIKGHERLGSRVVLSIIMLFGCGVGMSPWIVRNYVQFGRFLPATTHGGYTLALGNNSDFYHDVIDGADEFPWDGDALDRWQKRMIEQSIAEGVPADSETANDAWYYRQARAAIRQDPSAFVRACVLRLSRFWAVSTADESVPAVVRWATTGWYIFVWTGLVLNIASFIKRRSSPREERDREIQMLLWSVVGAFVAMHLVYWTDTRMRAPVMPMLAVLSASGWLSRCHGAPLKSGASTSPTEVNSPS